MFRARIRSDSNPPVAEAAVVASMLSVPLPRNSPTVEFKTWIVNMDDAREAMERRRGGSLSIVEVLVALFGQVLKRAPRAPGSDEVHSFNIGSVADA